MFYSNICPKCSSEYSEGFPILIDGKFRYGCKDCFDIQNSSDNTYKSKYSHSEIIKALKDYSSYCSYDNAVTVLLNLHKGTQKFIDSLKEIDELEDLSPEEKYSAINEVLVLTHKYLEKNSNIIKNLLNKGGDK